MKYWLDGEKYKDLIRKNANIRGKWWKNGGKVEIFTVPGEKILFLKKGVGQKFPILGKYTPMKNKILVPTCLAPACRTLPSVS